MELKQASDILKALADGIHPVTGEILPKEDSCNEPEVIRALHTVLAALPSLDKQKTLCQEEPIHAGKVWTAEEDKALCKMFDEGRSVQELCHYFGRSRGGIAARLVRLGKIDERKALKESRYNTHRFSTL